MSDSSCTGRRLAATVGCDGDAGTIVGRDRVCAGTLHLWQDKTLARRCGGLLSAVLVITLSSPRGAALGAGALCRLRDVRALERNTGVITLGTRFSTADLRAFDRSLASEQSL